MTGLDYFAWFVLIVLVLSLVAAVIVLGGLPGQIAASRGHPQRDAIRVAGWVGILFGGVFWPLALIWAFTRSPFLPMEPPETEADAAEAAQ